MATLELRLSTRLEGEYRGSNDVAAPVQAFDRRALMTLITGTSAGQADLVFSDVRTLAASASEDLDLAGGLTDAFGSTLIFAKIIALMVLAPESNVNAVLVGGATSNAVGSLFGANNDIARVPPGGMLLMTSAAGFAVQAGTGDLLKIANAAGGSAVNYEIVIIGRSV